MKAPLLSNVSLSKMDVKRKPNWTVEETVMLVEEVKAKKEIIKGKFNPTLTSRHKKEVWKQIADSINASFSSTIQRNAKRNGTMFCPKRIRKSLLSRRQYLALVRSLRYLCIYLFLFIYLSTYETRFLHIADEQ